MLPGLGYEVKGVWRKVSEAPVIVGVWAGKPWYWGTGGGGNWFRKCCTVSIMAVLTIVSTARSAGWHNSK